MLLAALVVVELAPGALAQAPAGTTPRATPPVAAPSPVSVAVPAPPPVVRPIEAIPDAWRLPPAELPAVNPLFRPVDTPPRIATPVPAPPLETRTTLFIAVKLGENGRASDAVAVEPPLRALSAPIPALVPKWRFDPAQKGGRPVATWATWSLELAMELENAVWSSFELKPVGKDDPLPKVVREFSGDAWLARFPKEVAPPEAGVVSVEEVDVLPVPDSTKWSVDAARLRAHVTALLEISESGAVARIVPTGEFDEPLLAAWLRKMAGGWKLTPAAAGGKPVACWASLDATLDYTLSAAKKKGEKSVKKNLRGRAD